MAKALKAGSEVDSWCTKCKLDLNHRIIAMVGTTIKRVVCLTCNGEHNYRVPKSAKKKVAPKKRATRARTSVAAQKRADELEKQQQQQLWEESIVGRPAEDFTRYKMSEFFEAGQLARHKKFGDGVVNELTRRSTRSLRIQSCWARPRSSI